jgi:Cu/Zn superoxide dismutase
MELRFLGFVASAALLAGWSGPAAAPQQSVKYAAKMNSGSETPANTEKATGTATLTLAGSQLRYTITVQGLSGPATAAHIHVGKVGVAGPPVYTFMIEKIAAGTLAQGSIDLTKDVSKGVSGDSLKVLLNNGNAYVNVHTAAHGAGEIRGQVAKQ